MAASKVQAPASFDSELVRGMADAFLEGLERRGLVIVPKRRVRGPSDDYEAHDAGEAAPAHGRAKRA